MVYARRTEVTVTSQTACITAFQEVFNVTERMFCGGNPDGVTCNGDWGDLLTVDGALAGFFSTGYGCGAPGVPDVYVNLANSEIMDFINDVTGISL